MSLVSITSRNPSSESVSPSSILDILDNALPKIFVEDFLQFCDADAAISNSSGTALIIATKLDKVFSFFQEILELKIKTKNVI